jgi:TRAP-type C4-dicarboxylate transport system substrate-binding protein
MSENEIKTAGRPKQHANAAERQKAYRERLKAAGMREVKTMIKDVRNAEKPLTSELIDLSAVRNR